MEKETREMKECITVEKSVYVLDWDELTILNELIAQSSDKYMHHSDTFFKLRKDVYNFMHER